MSLSSIKKGKPLSQSTKDKLSKQSQETTNFVGFNKSHTVETKIRMKLSKLDKNNPMYGKEGSLRELFII